MFPTGPCQDEPEPGHPLVHDGGSQSLRQGDQRQEHHHQRHNPFHSVDIDTQSQTG